MVFLRQWSRIDIIRWQKFVQFSLRARRVRRLRTVSSNVLFDNLSAARMNDTSAYGSPTVRGSSKARY